MEIKYHKMSLFDAPKESLLVHAVNCKGVWGSGIAVEMKKHFPKAFQQYAKSCEYNGRYNLGEYGAIYENNFTIINLYTSDDVAKFKDPEDEILLNTVLGLDKLLCSNYNEQIYSCKFNSGHFGVPWGKTEKIIKYLCKKYEVEWNVCDPNL